MEGSPGYLSRPAGGREALSVRELLPCRATDLSRWSRNAMTRLLGGALLVSALFAAPAVRAETECEKTLNSPPLSEIHAYISGWKGQRYRGAGFQAVFSEGIEGKNCKKPEIEAYLNKIGRKMEDYIIGNTNMIIYNYCGIIISLHRIACFLGWPITIRARFDVQGNYLYSNWSVAK